MLRHSRQNLLNPREDRPALKASTMQVSIASIEPRKSWLCFVIAFLLWGSTSACSLQPACKKEQTATRSPAVPKGDAGFFTYAHSHNDYEQPRPLETALEHRVYSVEVDIYHSSGELTVSHYPWGSKGTLKELYLDPLQARVDAKGSVYGDGLPFTLWIDLKDGDRELVDALYGLLDSYSMLTSFTPNGSIPGPVTAVLTGDAEGKKDLITTFSPRRATSDSNDYTPEDPPATTAWMFYALAWTDYLDSATGSLSDDDEERLACIAENAHGNGRQVRFYGAPDNPEYWRTALDFGVDYINTDNPAALEDFLAKEFSEMAQDK
jgi:Glycerophosphoryl diester phosphodiesterase family